MDAIFLSALNNEAITLATEARHYLQSLYARRQTRAQRTRNVTEGFRLTSQLAEVVSWIMAQQAVNQATLSPEQARRLGGGYFEENPDYRIAVKRQEVDLAELQDLLDRCRAFYDRVARLNASMAMTPPWQQPDALLDRDQRRADRPVLR
ncbi:MAG: DUF1465 family protein [Magnetospiraceae bacterium]